LLEIYRLDLCRLTSFTSKQSSTLLKKIKCPKLLQQLVLYKNATVTPAYKTGVEKHPFECPHARFTGLRIEGVNLQFTISDDWAGFSLTWKASRIAAA
jgi:hypothetical protein